jgi:hypothetical protein
MSADSKCLRYDHKADTSSAASETSPLPWASHSADILEALVRKAAKEATAGEEDGENGQAEKRIAMPNCVV